MGTAQWVEDTAISLACFAFKSLARHLTLQHPWLGKAAEAEHPSPLLPPHPCWSLQPTPGSALPHHPRESVISLPHISYSRWVPWRFKSARGMSRGDTEATDCSMQNPRRGGRKKRKQPWPEPTQTVGWFMFRQLCSLKGCMRTNT